VLELSIFYRSVETHTKPILYIQYVKREQNNFRTSYMLFVYYKCVNCIGGVMVSVLAASAYIMGPSPDRVKPKTIQLVFVPTPLSTQHLTILQLHRGVQLY
jgi:hypothetical protein